MKRTVVCLSACLMTSWAVAQQQQPPAEISPVWTSAKVREAAGKIQPAKVTTFALPPDLEAARLAEPPAPELSADNFSDTAAATTVTLIEDSRFAIRIREAGYQNWFLIHVTGVPAGGKIVRFDLENAAQSKLSTFNPVYTYAADLSALDTYAPVPADAGVKMLAASAGAIAPDTSAMPWRYMPATWRSTPTDLSFVTRLEKDVYVALRVPYTLGYHAAFTDTLKGQAGVAVHDLATTDGPGAKVIEIGADDPAVRRRNPCVVVYTREDGDQQDGSWFIEGIARHLAATTDSAKVTRQKCTFLLIPVIDPQAVTENAWTARAMRFNQNDEPRTLAGSYEAFFRDWVAGGGRIDVAVDLFTPQSAETSHLSYTGVSGVAANKLAVCRALEPAFAASNFYQFTAKPGDDKDLMSQRLVGFLRDRFGATPLAFFVNAQDRTRHLSLDELRQMGGLFAGTLGDFLNTAAAAGVIKTADAVRAKAGGQ